MRLLLTGNKLLNLSHNDLFYEDDYYESKGNGDNNDDDNHHHHDQRKGKSNETKTFSARPVEMPPPFPFHIMVKGVLRQVSVALKGFCH